MKSKKASNESVSHRTFPQTTPRSFRYFLVTVIGRIFKATVKFDIPAESDSSFLICVLDSFRPFAAGLTLVKGLPFDVPLPFTNVLPLGVTEPLVFDILAGSRSETVSPGGTDFFELVLGLNNLDKTGSPQQTEEQDLECGAIFAMKGRFFNRKSLDDSCLDL